MRLEKILGLLVRNFSICFIDPLVLQASMQARDKKAMQVSSYFTNITFQVPTIFNFRENTYLQEKCTTHVIACHVVKVPFYVHCR